MGNADKGKQVEYYSNLFRGLNIKDFIEDEDTRKKRAAPELDLPKIDPLAGDAPAGGIASPAPTLGNTPAMPPVGSPTTPAPGGMAPSPMPPAPKPPMGGGLGAPTGIPTPAPLPGPPPLDTKDDSSMSKKEKEDLLNEIKDLKLEIDNLRQDVKMQGIIDVMNDRYDEINEELETIKSRKVPSREYFDTEGVYSEHLFGMVTQVLDEFLPELFEEIPDYHFLSSQISRVYKDGTVADAIVSLMARVNRNKDRYDFKVEVPILNGLIQKPLYIERGAKIIPLTKGEIQRELESMSYRQVGLEVEQPYQKEQLFSNIGDNLHRRPDGQKAYHVRMTKPKQVTLPPHSQWKNETGD